MDYFLLVHMSPFSFNKTNYGFQGDFSLLAIREITGGAW